MKIQVLAAYQQGSRFTIELGHGILDTPEGRRALRIIFSHIYHGHSISRTAIRMDTYHGDDVSAIDSREKCQAEMDRLANVPLTVEFAPTEVIAPGLHVKEGALPSTIEQVQELRAKGRVLAVVMRFRLNLPAIRYDEERLREVIPGEVYANYDGEMGQIVATIYLQGTLEDAHPWDLVESLKPRIREVLV